MIFIRYENWKSYVRYYPVTCLLILANVIMFILTVINGGSTNIQTLIDFGAIVDVSPYKEELWRYLAAIFYIMGFPICSLIASLSWCLHRLWSDCWAGGVMRCSMWRVVFWQICLQLRLVPAQL